MSAIGSGQGVNFFLIQTLSEVDSAGGGGGRVTLLLNTGFLHNYNQGLRVECCCPLAIYTVTALLGEA